MDDNVEVSYIKTYTVGEDEGRLAVVAKEFGLQQARTVKEQVRRRIPDVQLWNVFSDTNVEKCRMNATYTFQDFEDDCRLPSVG